MNEYPSWQVYIDSQKPSFMAAIQALLESDVDSEPASHPSFPRVRDGVAELLVSLELLQRVEKLVGWGFPPNHMIYLNLTTMPINMATSFMEHLANHPQFKEVLRNILKEVE